MTATYRKSPSASRPRHVIVLVGPTGSGKTEVSIPLAQHLGGEIISADSRQVYKYLDIGTAKPSTQLRDLVPHHFVDELLPDQGFNAGQFGTCGREVIEDIFRRKKTPVVVGGSGLYVQSLIDGFFEGPGAAMEIREDLEQMVQMGLVGTLIKQLRKVDPVYGKTADPTKPRRIIRALEVYRLTGKPLSQHQRESKVEISFTSFMYGLEWQRRTLYDRIDHRCDTMISDGLLNEVDALEEMGYAGGSNALNTVGYAEAFAYRRGEIPYDEMVRLFKQNSRRYAKRQLTWFRRDKRIHWVKMDEQQHPREVARRIAGMFQSAAG